MTQPPAHAVRQLKGEGEYPVWLVQRPGEEPRTLKTWRLTPVRRVQLALGIARPQRQINGAKLLQQAGVPTPPICGGWRLGRRDGRVIELEHVYVEGRSALELATTESTPAAELRRVSAAVGGIVASMLAAGVLNKDLKLNNIIIAGDGTIWVIDTDGVRRSGKRLEDAARMLERLGVQLTVMGPRPGPEVWVPAMRHALRPLSRPHRRAVVRLLKAHRPP